MCGIFQQFNVKRQQGQGSQMEIWGLSANKMSILLGFWIGYFSDKIILDASCFEDNLIQA